MREELADRWESSGTDHAHCGWLNPFFSSLFVVSEPGMRRVSPTLRGGQNLGFFKKRAFKQQIS